MSRQLEQNQTRGLKEFIDSVTPQDAILSPNPTFEISGTGPLYAEISPIPMFYRLGGVGYAIDTYDPENLGGYAEAGKERIVLVTLTNLPSFKFYQSAESASPVEPIPDAGELIFARGLITDSGASTQPVSNTLNVIYIAEWGSDDNDGLSINTPKLTLAACDEVGYADGWIICLGGGTFAFTQVASMKYDFRYATLNNVSIDSAGTAYVIADKITSGFESIDNAKVIIDCNEITGDFYSQNGDVYFVRHCDITGNYRQDTAGFSAVGSLDVSGTFENIGSFTGIINGYFCTKGNNSNSKSELKPNSLELTAADGTMFPMYADPDNECLSYTRTDGGSIQIGQEIVLKFRNLDAVPHVNGDVVSIVVSPGNQRGVQLTNATSQTSVNAIIAVCTVASIDPNEHGFYTLIGELRDFNTNSWVEGTELFVDPLNNGKLTSTKPSAPNYIVRVGTVSVKSATVGVINVHPAIELPEATNAQIDNEATTIVNAYVSPVKFWRGVTRFLAKTGNVFAEIVTFSKGFVLTPVVQAANEPNNSIVNGKSGTVIYFTDNTGARKEIGLADNTVLYYSTKMVTNAFTATVTGGTTVTASGSMFTSAMANPNAKIIINGEIRYITTFISFTQVIVNEAFTQNYVAVTSANWGVYAVKMYESGGITYFNSSTTNSSIFAVQQTRTTATTYADSFSSYVLTKDEFRLGKDFKIKFYDNSNVGSGAVDSVFERVAAGLIGLTSGTSGQYRDFVLRTLQSLINNYQYNAASPTADTVNDTRWKDDLTNIDLEQCTVAGGSKGIGTWATRLFRIVKATGEFIVSKITALSAKFGTGSDYAEFSTTGFLTFNGAATYFDDLLGDLTRAKTTGTRVTINDTENSLDFTDASTLTDYVFFNYQMSHRWKVASIIYPHFHMWQTSANLPNILIQYRWQINGQAKTTAWTSLVCNIPVFTYVSGTLNQIIKTASGLTPPANAALSDILQFRVIRDTANTSGLFAGADPVAGTISLMSGDTHIECNKLGTDNEFN